VATEKEDSIPSSILDDISRAETPVSPRQDLPPLPEGDIFATPSGGERATALGTGFARGAAESGTLMGTTYLGGKVGAAVAPFTGPAAPFMPVAGALAGFGYGLYASDIVGKMFPEVERKDLEFAYEGARTFGGGLAFSPLALTFRKAPETANKFSKVISSIGEFARANPKKYFATEGIVSFYAGLAGGAAVSAFPDSPLVRPAAEITAAAFMPARLAFQLKDTVVNGVKKAFTTPSVDNIPDNVKQYVGTNLVSLWEEAGEDPKAFIKLMEDSLKTMPLTPGGTPVTPPTVAQLTGSKTATGLEKVLAKNHAKYSSDTQQMAEEAMLGYKQAALVLESTGDPLMMKAAANIRKEALAKQFQTGFNQAQTAAVEKAAKLGEAGSDNRALVGQLLRDEMEKFTRLGRETESQLWDTAIRSAFKESGGTLSPVQVTPSNFTNALYEITASPFSSTSRTVLNKELKGMGADLGKIGLNKSKFKAMEDLPISSDYLDTRTLTPEAMSALDLKPASAADLVRFRGTLLEKAREAGSAGNSGAAHRYNQLADAILDDLSALPGNSYNEARAFSREFNDAFTRTFAGEMDRVTARGKQMYSPEVLVQRAFAGNADTTLQRMREMEAAANFIDPKGDAATSVRDAQDKVLRAFAAETMNPDGTVDLARFDAFRKKNQDALRYLGMDDEFKDIASAQRSLLDIGDQDTLMARYLKDEKTFATLLEMDDPVFAISSVINSKTPVRGFKSLVETADSHTDSLAARRGLVHNIYQYAYNTADKGADGFNASVFQDIFFKPLSPNAPSLAYMMRSSNLMSGEELGRLKQLTQKMSNVENALSTRGAGIDPEKVFTAQDGIEALATSMMGAKFASTYGPGGSGSLVFASASVRFVKDLFQGMPARNRLFLIEEATKDPKLMSDLMKRGMTEQQERALQLGILRHLYPPSVFPTAVDRYMQMVPPEEPAPEPGPTLRPRPPAPLTRGTPNLQLPTDQGPAGQAQQAQAPGQPPIMPSNSRQMLQQLFPNDATLQTTPMG